MSLADFPHCILRSVHYHCLMSLSADLDSDTSLLSEGYRVLSNESLVQIMKNTTFITVKKF